MREKSTAKKDERGASKTTATISTRVSPHRKGRRDWNGSRRAPAFKAHKRCTQLGGFTFDFSRQWVAVEQYYDHQQPEGLLRRQSDRPPPFLRDLGHKVNRKLLEVERLSHHCVLTQDALDRVQRPTVEVGERVSALRFADPQVIALFQAITAFTHLPRGFRNRDPRPYVAALLVRPCSTA
jgi:hypothetical protein